MKKTTYISLLASAIFIFNACGGGGGSTPTSDTSIVPTVQGSGTLSDPYIVGNGTHDSAKDVYFKINMNLGTSTSCGLIAFNKLYSGSLYEAELYDSNYNLVSNDSGYGWDIVTSGEYIIKADSSSLTTDEKLHIYSNCITSGTIDINLVNIGLNSFSGEKTHIYKIVLAQNSSLDVNGVNNIFGITYYDSNFIDLSPYFNVGRTSKSMSLLAGTYYILIENSSRDDETSFSVVVTPN